MSDVTRNLSQTEAGDPSAAEQFLPIAYEELRKLAVAKLAQEQRAYKVSRVCRDPTHHQGGGAATTANGDKVHWASRADDARRFAH
jgi:hypothetical protein